MAITSAEKQVRELLAGTDVEIGGSNPWDPCVHDQRFYNRVLAQGSLGLGESYMDGWWDCDRLDQFFHKILAAGLKSLPTFNVLLTYLRAKLFNLQKRSRAFQIGERHYDLGNELFQAMLDSRMNYSCGYWLHASNLEEAQEAKLDLICRKIGLMTGDRVLDIGCGWGGFVHYAAEKHQARAVGITVSREQAAFAQKRCDQLPVEIRLQDYRALDETFDHIVSVGMVEHVGYKNYRSFMATAHQCLGEDGLFLLQTIGSKESALGGDPWISRYIFPNGMLPSIAQLARAAEGLFVIEDLHNFGADYDKTLMAWHSNFELHWDRLAHKYDERFRRMWRYYLLSCAGASRARSIQLWQILFSKKGVKGGYHSVR